MQTYEYGSRYVALFVFLRSWLQLSKSCSGRPYYAHCHSADSKLEGVMRAGPISGCCDMTAGLTSSFAADEARRVDEDGRVCADEARRELILGLL